MKDRQPDFGKIERKSKTQGRARDLYQDQKAWMVDHTEEYENVKELMSLSRTLSDRIEAGLAYVLSRYVSWQAPRILKSVGKWSDKYGEDLERAVAWYEKEIASKDQEIRTYLRTVYGMNLTDLDLNAELPEQMRDDAALASRVDDYLKTVSDYRAFQEKYLYVPIENEEKAAGKALAEFTVELFPELGVPDLTPEEKEFLSLSSSLETLEGLVTLYRLSASPEVLKDSTHGLAAEIRELQQKAEEARAALAAFEEKHPQARAKAGFKVHTRKK
jgi:hypothetical protein